MVVRSLVSADLGVLATFVGSYIFLATQFVKWTVNADNKQLLQTLDVDFTVPEFNSAGQLN